MRATIPDDICLRKPAQNCNCVGFCRGLLHGSDVMVQATNWLADGRAPRLVRHALTALRGVQLWWALLPAGHANGCSCCNVYLPHACWSPLLRRQVSCGWLYSIIGGTVGIHINMAAWCTITLRQQWGNWEIVLQNELLNRFSTDFSTSSAILRLWTFETVVTEVFCQRQPTSHLHTDVSRTLNEWKLSLGRKSPTH